MTVSLLVLRNHEDTRITSAASQLTFCSGVMIAASNVRSGGNSYKGIKSGLLLPGLKAALT